MSTSFPFLAIARAHGRTYGHVIRMVQDVENRLRLGDSYLRAIRWNMDLDGPAAELLRAVVKALEAEDQRRLGTQPIPIKPFTGMPGAIIGGECAMDWEMSDGSIRTLTPSEVRTLRQHAGVASLPEHILNPLNSPRP